jgi:asparagine synthase (glutamine-hydrolysing)
MCGICGYYSWSGRPLDQGRIEAMTASLRHRGPDDSGVHVQGGVALGHARLSIIDLSPAGHQPMCNEDGTIWLVYNGEIYNYPDLRAELVAKGHVFRSETDSEVIIHLYEELGPACARRFNGMFAFAIWDQRARRLLLARDRAGQKPLFYCRGKDFLVFGSEIKALLASGLIEPRVCPEAVQIALLYNAMAAPLTGFEGVFQLMPATWMAQEGGKEMTERYWHLPDILAENEPGLPRSEGEWLEAFRERFEQSVRMRMRSDAPYGAFLSGGLDSTAVVRAMAASMPRPVRTFAFGFEQSTFDETSFAMQAAEAFGTSHVNVSASEAELPELLYSVVRHGEEYTPNPCFIPVYLLCRGASGEVKMILSGDGGDEILAGYETYQATMLAQVYGVLPLSLRRLLARAASRIPRQDGKVPLGEKLQRFAYGALAAGKECHAYWRFIFPVEEIGKILAEPCRSAVKGRDPAGIYKGLLGEAGKFSFLGSLLYSDFSYYMPNDALVKMDRMGMAHGVEIRNPFLDYRLVELCFRMPDSLKLRWFVDKKHALKRYLSYCMPREFLQRKKAGFNVPVDAWLRHQLKEVLCDVLRPSRVSQIGFFNADAVTALLRDHLDKRANNGLKLWNVLCFHIWHEMFLSGSNPDVARSRPVTE